MTADPFSAFDERVARRLNEMRDDAAKDYMEVTYAMARGGAGGGRHVIGHLGKAKLHLERAIDWALTEADNLPGQPHATRLQIHPNLKKRLTEHLNGLLGLVCRMDGTPSVDGTIEQERTKLSGLLDGELNDFAAHIWRPRTLHLAAGHAKYEINVGENRGSIQVAGSGSSQIANISNVENAFGEFYTKLDKAEIAEEIKNEIRAEVETLRLQARRTSPNKTVMHAAASGLTQLTLGVAGNLLTPHVITLLAALGLTVGS